MLEQRLVQSKRSKLLVTTLCVITMYLIYLSIYHNYLWQAILVFYLL